MRILLAGDTHGDSAHLRYLMECAKGQDCDRIFVLGDFGYWEHEDSGIRFLDRVNLMANLKNMPIYFLDGNHDKTSLLLEKYNQDSDRDSEGFIWVRPYIRYAQRGHRWTWHAIKFIALGGAYSVDKDWRLELERKNQKPESLWFPEEEMSNEDMARIIAQDPSPVDVILAHDKPRSSDPNWNRKTFAECFPNQDRLELAIYAFKPSYFFHGHLHYRYTYRTVNPGKLTMVVGLHCNKEGAMESWNYDGRDSWWVFDTEDIRDRYAEEAKEASLKVASTGSTPRLEGKDSVVIEPANFTNEQRSTSGSLHQTEWFGEIDPAPEAAA